MYLLQILRTLDFHIQRRLRRCVSYCYHITFNPLLPRSGALSFLRQFIVTRTAPALRRDTQVAMQGLRHQQSYL
jgi:hypothetical protein